MFRSFNCRLPTHTSDLFFLFECVRGAKSSSLTVVINRDRSTDAMKFIKTHTHIYISFWAHRRATMKSESMSNIPFQTNGTNNVTFVRSSMRTNTNSTLNDSMSHEKSNGFLWFFGILLVCAMYTFCSYRRYVLLQLSDLLLLFQDTYVNSLFLFGISPQVESIDGSNATKYSPNYCYVWYAKWFLNIRSTKAPHRFGFEHQGTAEIRDFLVYIYTSSKPHSFLWFYRHISRKPPIMIKNHTMRSKMTLLLETFVPCTWPLHQNQNGPYNIRFIVVTVSQQMPLQIWRLMNW